MIDTIAPGSFALRASRAIGSARREPGLALGCLILALLLLVALVPQLFTAHSPFTVDVGKTFQPPSAAHWFGTDDTGRDVFARVVHGTRVTLSICAGALLLAALIGGALGLVSGYVGGMTDLALGRLADVILSFPPIILGIVITGVLGPQTRNLVLALTLIYVPVFLRIARSGVLTEVNLTYVEAARCLGLSDTAILFNHVLRNVLPLITMQYVVLFPLVLQIQAALGFLGLGVQPPTPDWGAILQQGKDAILYAPWLSVFPGLTVLITSLSLSLIGQALQGRIDRR
jgi:ABC-type dipeptide/oligopeptide/nickel transport system permease subunit